ncbi:hypothetical protein Goari_018895 [Gossypium aridum]|uniref:Ubiquitin thioesterase OTU n=1 Tax=Gossypium aridum TaxID=34290 RepID=A0A7J8WSD6_GOSAI|nr:hypothetical protein [Gossypium aridum]
MARVLIVNDVNQVKGMAFNKGIALRPQEERDGADELRMAVKEILCDSAKDRQQYEEALIAITVEESLKRYCQRIQRPDFWGGESELLVSVLSMPVFCHFFVETITMINGHKLSQVLSRLCSQPIVVYIPEHEHRKGGWGFIPIAEYGSEFRKGFGKGKPKKVVRLLYSGRNHYDLLV